MNSCDPVRCLVPYITVSREFTLKSLLSCYINPMLEELIEFRERQPVKLFMQIVRCAKCGQSSNVVTEL